MYLKDTKYDLMNNTNNNNIIVLRIRCRASYFETEPLPTPSISYKNTCNNVRVCVYCRIENSLYYIMHTGDFIS